VISFSGYRLDSAEYQRRVSRWSTVVSY